MKATKIALNVANQRGAERFDPQFSLASIASLWPTEFKELCSELEIETATKMENCLRWVAAFGSLLRGLCDVLKPAAICCGGVQMIVQLERNCR